MQKFMSEADLRQVAPSIYAKSMFKGCSNKYSFYPTSKVIDALALAGWFPFDAKETKVRRPDRIGHQKHMMRFRQMGAWQEKMLVGDSVIEAILVNAHDATSSYSVYAGVFRFTCSNGMVVADGSFPRMSIRHYKQSVDEIVTATLNVVESAPKIASKITAMKQKKLTTQEQVAFAMSALSVKFNGSFQTLPPSAVLHVRRPEDTQADLWSTLNVVQENLIKGGIDGKSRANKRTVSRGIKAIQEDIRINKGLWALAERML